MDVINYKELVSRRQAVEDALKGNRRGFAEDSGEYQRLTTLMGCANRSFTHAYVTGDTESFDMLEGDLARLIGNVVSPDTARDPALERRALEMLKSAVFLPN